MADTRIYLAVVRKTAGLPKRQWGNGWRIETAPDETWANRMQNAEGTFADLQICSSCTNFGGRFTRGLRLVGERFGYLPCKGEAFTRVLRLVDEGFKHLPHLP